MASITRVVTKDRRNGKPVTKYKVGYREPVYDDDGLQVKGKYRNRSETFWYATEAQAFKDEVEAARHTGGVSTLTAQRRAGELPFGYYAREWLSALDIQVAKGKLKQGTADEYKRLLHCYVLPELGETAVASVTPRRCEQLLASLVRQPSRQGDRNPLSPGTVKHAYDVLRRVMKYAQRHGAITVNPCDAIDFGGAAANGDREKFEHRPLTVEQIGALSAAIAGIPPVDYIGPTLPAYPVYALMIEFMGYTGLRAAEVSGLEVADIVFAPSADPHTVKASVQVRRTKHRSGGQWITGTLKTRASRRTVPLPSWLAARMADYLQTVHERAGDPTAPLWPSRKNGGGHRAEGRRYAVPLDWANPLALGAFYDTIMKPALEAVGLPASRPATADRPAVRGVRVHDLRHAAAVMMLTGAGGAVKPTPFMKVSKLLGHATKTVTLDTYGDWIEADDTAAPELPAPPAPNAAPRRDGGTVVGFRQQTG